MGNLQPFLMCCVYVCKRWPHICIIGMILSLKVANEEENSPRMNVIRRVRTKLPKRYVCDSFLFLSLPSTHSFFDKRFPLFFLPSIYRFSLSLLLDDNIERDGSFAYAYTNSNCFIFELKMFGNFCFCFKSKAEQKIGFFLKNSGEDFYRGCLGEIIRENI